MEVEVYKGVSSFMPIITEKMKTMMVTIPTDPTGQVCRAVKDGLAVAVTLIRARPRVISMVT